MLKIAADSFGLTISEAIYPLRIVAKQGLQESYFKSRWKKR